MKINCIKKITGLIAIIAGVSFGLYAQEKNDAIKAFNEGVELMKIDPSSAIGPFENCIKICEQIGDSAEDVKLKAIQVLPDLYFQKAFDLLTIDRKLDESLSASKVALGVAEKYGDIKVKENVQRIMVQVYSTKGSAYFSSNENDKAISAFDSALAINPDHLPSIFNKALIYNKLGDSQKFGETIDLYIEKIRASGDTSKIAQPKKLALDYYRIAGGKANQANNLNDAITLLKTANKYGADKNLYYQFASVYNKQKKFSNAEESAQKGLDLETGDVDAKAKFYYELGTAQAGLGKTADACESLKNAMYGPFLQAAKAQRTNMKCQ
jgi:tetratricopeptide (TPR) repeat protein